MIEIKSGLKNCIPQALLDKDEAFKNGNKKDVLYKIRYRNDLIIYGVGHNILDCMYNIGPLNVDIQDNVKSFIIVLDWNHFLNMEPIRYSYFSPYRRKISVTDNFDCYNDEYLNLWFVVNKTTNHSIKLFNIKEATKLRSKKLN